MVLLDNDAIFASGTAVLQMGPIKLRHTIRNTPGSYGARLDIEGKQVRQIDQVGCLIADTSLDLQALIDAIQSKLDGLTHTLFDEHGKAWTDCVMISFKSGAFIRIGARWRCDYTIEYLQVKP